MPKQRTGYVYFDKKRKTWAARFLYTLCRFAGNRIVCDGPHLYALPCSCAFVELGVLRWEKTLWGDCAQSGVKMQQAEWEVVMLRKAIHSACCLTYGFAVTESNYRAELMALSVGRLADSGVGHGPKRPTVFCGRRVPKRPTFALIFLTSSREGVS